MTRAHLTPIVVLAAALAALGASIGWTVTRGDGQRFAMMRLGAGMMGQATAGSGQPVRDLSGARRQAARFAGRLDLRVGEVMRFDNHYYAELTDNGGRGATEVLVDPATGTVMLEPGPAMMWNTRYGLVSGTGMMGGPAGRGSTTQGPGGMMGAGGMMGDPTWTPGQARQTPAGKVVTAAEARTIAEGWLRNTDAALSAGKPESFPGYFTLHAVRGGRIDGMLSVNATTGAVWPHTWHGRFIEMGE